MGQLGIENYQTKCHQFEQFVHYAIRECNGSAEGLEKSLKNVVEHYKNIHTDCSENSTCQKFANYQPSKITIKDSNSERLLIQAIEKKCRFSTSRRVGISCSACSTRHDVPYGVKRFVSMKYHTSTRNILVRITITNNSKFIIKPILENIVNTL